MVIRAALTDWAPVERWRMRRNLAMLHAWQLLLAILVLTEVL